MSRVNLFTSFYPERIPERRSELVRCLQKNLENPDITSVSVFLEGLESPPIVHEKLVTRLIESRPSYCDFFNWANECQHAKNDVTVISNSDIYFDDSLALMSQAINPKQCAALARWNFGQEGSPVLFNRNDSQDAWVFRGLIKKVAGDFCVGIPRCDNRILFELKRAGYEVVNPAFSIRSYHLHEGIRGEYQNENLEHFVEPPYAYLWPHNLWSLPRTLMHNLRHPDARIGWRFDRRKFLNSLPVRAIRKVARGIGSSMAKSNT